MAPDLHLPMEVPSFKDAISTSIMERYARDLSHLVPFIRRYFDRLIEYLAESFPGSMKLELLFLATEHRVIIVVLNPKELMRAYFEMSQSLVVPQRFLSSANFTSSSSSTSSSSLKKRLRSSAHHPDAKDEDLYSAAAIEALIAEPSAEVKRKRTAKKK
jgi:hypothetical protein